MNSSSDNEAIRAQAAKIVASGVLGRSRFYASLLDYLVTCTVEGRAPKEIEIAADVFGRKGDFDPSQDSMVRVYAHNLRQKLQQFYASAGSDEPRQLAVPRGEYRLALVNAAEEESPVSMPAAAAQRFRPAWLIAVVLLLGVGIAAGMAIEGRLQGPAQSANPYDGIAASPLWKPLLDDDLPILIVVGDYFIFGELDSTGNIERLVREFTINSSKDLADLLMYDPEAAERYMDLDLTYLPRGAASALRDLLRVLYRSDKTVRVISMSELNVADVKTSHIVYVGYISGLDKLLDFVFASSQLAVGETFDELIVRDNNVAYTSEAGIPSEHGNYRDYGLFSTFPGPGGNQLFIVAGMRDPGLMQTAQELSEPMHLSVVEQAAAARSPGGPPAVELLFEVTGNDRTNLDAMIVHSSALDYGKIWGGELLLP
ncbi:MAG TPA: hypothetical protein VIC71_15065 [Gammaproteobacteria bacterium]